MLADPALGRLHGAAALAHVAGTFALESGASGVQGVYDEIWAGRSNRA